MFLAMVDEKVIAFSLFVFDFRCLIDEALFSEVGG